MNKYTSSTSWYCKPTGQTQSNLSTLYKHTTLRALDYYNLSSECWYENPVAASASWWLSFIKMQNRPHYRCVYIYERTTTNDYSRRSLCICVCISEFIQFGCFSVILNRGFSALWETSSGVCAGSGKRGWLRLCVCQHVNCDENYTALLRISWIRICQRRRTRNPKAQSRPRITYMGDS